MASSPATPLLATPDASSTSPPPSLWSRFVAAVKRLKHEVLVIHYAATDPRCPLLPKLIALLALAYALSPLDLIPDFIPVLGLVDDLIILPALLWMAVKLIPTDVMEEARERAVREPQWLQQSIGFGLFVVGVWVAALLWVLNMVIERFAAEDTWVSRYKYGLFAAIAAATFVAFGVWIIASKNNGQAGGSSSDSDNEHNSEARLTGKTPAEHEEP